MTFEDPYMAFVGRLTNVKKALAVTELAALTMSMIPSRQSRVYTEPKPKKTNKKRKKKNRMAKASRKKNRR